MALPTSLSIVTEGQRAGPQSELEVLVAVVNKLTTQMRVLTVKLDADATVTDTNYTALVTDVAGTSAPLITIIQ